MEENRLTKKQWIEKMLSVDEKEELAALLDIMYMEARQNGYDDGYCEGVGEGCDYDGRLYESVRYEYDDEAEEYDYDNEIDYEWDLK
jgi:hypothetical protein